VYTRDEVLLHIENVSQKYEDKVVLENLSIKIHNLHATDAAVTAGQVVGFLGPSGCGKTQLLRIISGLQRPTTGEVFIDADKKRMRKGMCGVVFQTYPLFLHRTVMGNLLLAGSMAGMTHAEAMNTANELLATFELEGSAEKFPGELSGGMQQRVAICQQLINMDSKLGHTDTRLMLLDEPFAALDPRNTFKTCKLLRKVADMHDLNTIVVVTHDIRAALSVSDVLWIMGRDRDENGKVCSGGKIIQELDLVNQGLTWHPEVESLPAFIKLNKDINELFHIL